jgi:dienelactone hydrolase
MDESWHVGEQAVNRRLMMAGVSALALAACVGSTKPNGDAVYHTGPGPYPVEVANITLRDDAQAKDLPLRVAYPATRGRFPVVVLSHGGGASKDDYTRAGDHWVSYGYIVIAPTHKDSKSLGFDMAKAGGPGMTLVMNSRIADMQFIAGHLNDVTARVPGLAARMNTSQLVAAGHSMGGFTALAAAGVRLKNKADGSMLEMPSAGYTALVLLSEPGSNPMMPDEPWRQSPVPTFVYTGTNDKGAETTGRKSPFGYNVVDNAAAVAQPKHYLWVNDVDHYLGGLWARTDVSGPADAQGLQIFSAVSTVFLEAYTKNNARARMFLDTADIGPLTQARATLSRK